MATLTDVGIGGQARVVGVRGAGAFEQRLLEMGLVPGVEVRVVRQAPLGDPIEVRLLGYSLSLRRSEAAHVDVESLL